MKHLEATISKDEADNLEKILKSLDLVYAKSESEIKIGKELRQEPCFVYSVIVPDGFLDNLLNQVTKSIDLRKKENIITVHNQMVTISPYLD